MIPRGLITLNHNLLSAVDTETTGLVDGYHEVVQVAVVPASDDLEVLDVPPFYMNIRPEYPERASKRAMQKNGLSLEELELCPSKWDATEAFDEWFHELNLPLGKKLVWLCHNSPHDIPFIKAWLGEEAFHRYFYFQGRDSMNFATGLNDLAAYRCQPVPFPDISLPGLAKKFGIINDKEHDALADGITTIGVYRELLRWEGV